MLQIIQSRSLSEVGVWLGLLGGHPARQDGCFAAVWHGLATREFAIRRQGKQKIKTAFQVSKTARKAVTDLDSVDYFGCGANQSANSPSEQHLHKSVGSFPFHSDNFSLATSAFQSCCAFQFRRSTGLTAQLH
jgi:hypothetical protein